MLNSKDFFLGFFAGAFIGSQMWAINVYAATIVAGLKLAMEKQSQGHEVDEKNPVVRGDFKIFFSANQAELGSFLSDTS